MSCKSRRSFCCEIFYLIELYILECRGVATGEGRGGGGGGHAPLPLQIPNQTMSNSFRSVPSIRNIAFNKCSEIMRPEISQFLPFMLQFLDNLWRLFIFSNYIWEIDHFTLDLLRRFDT